MAISTIDEAGLGIQAYGNRNLIINGAMQVAQRGTSFTAQTSQFVVDRFSYNSSGVATMDLDQSSDAPNGFLNSAKLTLNAVDSSIGSTDYYQLIHKIEGQNMAHLNWGSSSAKTVTVSFWVKSSVAGDYPLRIINGGGTKSYAFYFTIDAANTWEYKTETIEGPTDGTFPTTNSTGVEIGFGLAQGSTYTGATADQWNTVSSFASSNLANNTGWIGTTDNTFQVTGVQLEVGDTATPFEHRLYGDELVRCQRYFEKRVYSGGYQYIAIGVNVSSTIIRSDIYFNVEKRAVPTMSGSAASTWRVNAINNDATANSISFYSTEVNAMRMDVTRGTGSHTTREAGYLNVENLSPYEAYWQADAEL